MLNRMLMVGAIALTLAFGATTAQAQAVCGEESPYTLWAGQNIDVGTLTVSNDDTNLYLTFELDEPWWFTEVHVYVDEGGAEARLTPGKAPYKSGNISYVYSYEMEIPLASLDFNPICESLLWIQAHAAVVQYDDDDNIVKGETAYGGGVTKPERGAWFGNISYERQCCGDDSGGDVLCNTETAFGGDIPGPVKDNNSKKKNNNDTGAWWYFYDNLVGGEQPLWAGQTMQAGTVEVVGNTIYIVLAEGWGLQEDDESVKIQGYNEADLPANRPPAGQFTTYKGSDLIISGVPDFDFYVIHLDVEFCGTQQP